jgi:hypothetical protein
MTRFSQERDSVRLRNGKVTAVSGSKVTVDLDGVPIPNVPVHGPVPAVNARVLVLSQGGSLTVLGNAVSELTQLRTELGELRELVQALIERGGFDG